MKYIKLLLMCAFMSHIYYEVRWKAYTTEEVYRAEDWTWKAKPKVVKDAVKFESKEVAIQYAKDQKFVCDTCFDVEVYEVREKQIR